MSNGSFDDIFNKIIACWCTPDFIVLERNSKIATMFSLPTLARRPQSVVWIALGWWAKSSYKSSCPTVVLMIFLTKSSPNYNTRNLKQTPLIKAKIRQSLFLISFWMHWFRLGMFCFVLQIKENIANRPTKLFNFRIRSVYAYFGV
jgi:hypothetical protein